MKKYFGSSVRIFSLFFLAFTFFTATPLYATSTENIAASSYYLNATPDLAFDGILSQDNYWISDGSPSSDSSEWISYDFGTPTLLKSYGIYRFDSDEQFPSSWTFEGWDEESNEWVVLDSQIHTTDRIFTLSDVSAYAKYRFNITAVASGSGRVNISEIGFIKAPEPVVMGPVAASSSYADFCNPSMCFDGIISMENYWSSFDYVTPDNAEWISYTFDTAKIIDKYTISTYQYSGPKDWILQGWDESNSQWIDLDSQNNITWGGDSEVSKTFTVSNPDSYAKYRLYITGSYCNDRVIIGEITFSEKTSEPEVTGAVAASSYAADYCSPTNCFDGIISMQNYWASRSLLQKGDYEWISYTFDEEKTINKYVIHTHWSLEAPSEWTLQGFDELENEWVTLDSQSNVTDWFGQPRKEFTVSTPGSYAKYRLHITETVGGEQVMIGEIELLEN